MPIMVADNNDMSTGYFWQILFYNGVVLTMDPRAPVATALAVTGEKRSAMLPQVPTMAEAGLPNVESYAWFGLWAPAGTSSATVDRIAQDVERALASPDVREKLAGLGADPTPSTPERFGAVMRADAEKWGRIIRQAGVRAE